MPEYRTLSENDICRNLFRQFIRRQVVRECWRKEGDTWVIREDPFIDDWSEEDYQVLVTCLKNTVSTGGLVYGFFFDGSLKGFVSVESSLFGNQENYLDLTSLHVSEDLRGNGIGKTLFLKAARWAKAHGADKLYISAHSAVETQTFYRAMGCVEAQEYHRQHVEAEPFDCQLEYLII